MDGISLAEVIEDTDKLIIEHMELQGYSALPCVSRAFKFCEQRVVTTCRRDLLVKATRAKLWHARHRKRMRFLQAKLQLHALALLVARSPWLRVHAEVPHAGWRAHGHAVDA